MTDWVEKLKDESRRNYYKSQIVIECPFGKHENRIRDCVDYCAMSEFGFKEGSTFIYCSADEPMQRYLHTGKPLEDL